MAALQYSGNSTFMTGSLASSYTSGGGSLALTSGHGARFPSAGDFWVRVDDEIFKVTSRTGDTLTVTGAQDGTSAANHSAGSTVRWVLSAAALDQLRTDQSATGAYASAATAKAGNLYLPNNSRIILRDSGAAMIPWGPIYPLTTPPLASAFTAHNAGSATLTDSVGGLRLECPASATAEIHAWSITDSPPFTVTALINFDLRAGNFNSAGLCFTDGTKFVVCEIQFNTSQFEFAVAKWTTATSFSAGYTINAARTPEMGLLWFKIEDDGSTNRICSYSTDGVNFRQLHSVGRTDFLTATAYGVFVKTQNATYACGATIHSMLVS